MKFKTAEDLNQNKEERLLKLNPDDPASTIDIISQIEGKNWANQQRELFGDERKEEELARYTLRAATEAVKKVKEYLDNLHQELSSTNDNDIELENLIAEIERYESGFGPRAEIYGEGGRNRYFVLSNGEVVMSKSHMGINEKKYAQLAEKFGIRIV